MVNLKHANNIWSTRNSTFLVKTKMTASDLTQKGSQKKEIKLQLHAYKQDIELNLEDHNILLYIMIVMTCCAICVQL